MTRNTLIHTIRSSMKTVKGFGKLRYLLPLACGLISAEYGYAVQGTEFIAPPKYNLTDRFSVNHFSGTVSVNVNTVSIGGERGLSHSVMAKNHFVSYPGNHGYTDRFAGAVRYKKLGENKALYNGGPTYQILWVMQATALGDSADFLVMRDGEYADGGFYYENNYYYEALGDKRHKLTIEGNRRVWTKPDGTRVYFSGASGIAGISGSLKKIVYPTGFTINIHGETSVTTNTGFQLKYDYIDDDPGLPPEKQDYEFAGSTNVPSETLSESTSWWLKNPKYVRGINNAVEYCNPDTIDPCILQNDWPTATFHWPGGMPRAVFINESTVRIVNATGKETRLHYEGQDGALGDLDDPDSVIDGEVANSKIAPRLVAVTRAGADEPTVQYTYKNEFRNWETGHGAGVYVDYDLLPGELIAADGIKGQTGYSHNEGQWGETVHRSGRMEAHVSSTFPGTLQRVDIYGRTTIGVFEVGYRNFPKTVVENPGPVKGYHYDEAGNTVRVSYPDHEGQDVYRRAEYPDTCDNPKTCHQPVWVRDPKGNYTYYTYHEPSGQVASVTSPPDDQGQVAQTRYKYEQKYAYHLNASGERVAYDTPVWLLTEESYCRNSNYTDESCEDDDEVVTRYEYDHDNLLRTGETVTADGQTLRTCYRYDRYGNQIGETRPKADLSSCE